MLRFVDTKERWTRDKPVRATLTVPVTRIEVVDGTPLERPVRGDDGEIVMEEREDLIRLPPNAEAIYSDQELAAFGLERFTPPPPPPPPPPEPDTRTDTEKFEERLDMSVDRVKTVLGIATESTRA